jgi:hypothetical protein
MRSRAGAPYLLGVQCAESMMQGRTASLSTATRALLKQLQVELDGVKLIAASFAGGGAAYRCNLIVQTYHRSLLIDSLAEEPAVAQLVICACSRGLVAVGHVTHVRV